MGLNVTRSLSRLVNDGSVSLNSRYDKCLPAVDLLLIYAVIKNVLLVLQARWMCGPGIKVQFVQFLS